MTDPRNKKLAKILIDYSVDLRSKDKLVISCSSPLALPLAKEVYKTALLKGAFVKLNLADESLNCFFFKNAKTFQLEKFPEVNEFEAKWLDKFISITAPENTRQLSNVDPKKIITRMKTVDPIKKTVLKKPWLITYYPTPAMAQDAKLSTEEMEDFYFKACLQDWPKEAEKLKKLKQILDNCKKLKIIGEKTNLTLSFKNRSFQICAAKHNMPDGEIFSCPLETSANGIIYFDFPSLRQGKEVTKAFFVFKNGWLVKFGAEKNKEFLKQSLNIDKGAKRLGEFAIGANYGINRFMYNTLFDEKIGGTIHLALGQAFSAKKPGGGKNKSAIHWDFVKDTRKKGSKVIADNKVILKDGKIF